MAKQEQGDTAEWWAFPVQSTANRYVSYQSQYATVPTGSHDSIMEMLKQLVLF